MKAFSFQFRIGNNQGVHRNLSFFNIGLLETLAFLILSFLVFRKFWDLNALGAYIGENQYGDAEFWWNGAFHFAQGIFRDNPGVGFRPGYFFFAGLTIPLFGTDYFWFHKLLILGFLLSLLQLYLQIKKRLGFSWAFLSVIAISLNPYMAEWMATSTTDALGVIFHMLAVSSLLKLMSPIADGENRKKEALLFGILFALATLTRPLVTPFIGVALACLVLFLDEASLKKRFRLAAMAAVAFGSIVFSWMGAQKLLVGEWSISSNDASAFYAASDPKIQVWKPEMYTDVEASVRKRDGLSKETQVSNARLNKEFWTLAVQNFALEWKYHLTRLPSHLTALASFDSSQTREGLQLGPRPYWKMLFIVGMFLLSFKVLFSGRLLFSIVCFYFSFYFKDHIDLQHNFVFLGILGSFYSGILKKQARDLPFVMLSLFWLTGAMALAAVGGTWNAQGPTHSVINALGYRLISQFLFAGDILKFFALACLVPAPMANSVRQDWIDVTPTSFSRFWKDLEWRSLSSVGVFLNRVFLVFCSAVAIFGLIQIGRNTYIRSHTDVVKFPEQPLEWKSFRPPSFVADGWIRGQFSPFIWNLADQHRTMALFYGQENLWPQTFNPARRPLEIHQDLDQAKWRFRQGLAWIAEIPSAPVASSEAYYQNETVLLSFIPLRADKKEFDLTARENFPLELSPSRLLALKMLSVEVGTLELLPHSAGRQRPRTVLLKPDDTGVVRLRLHLKECLNAKNSISILDQQSLVAAPEFKGPYFSPVAGGKVPSEMITSFPFLRFLESSAKGTHEISWSGIPKEGLLLFELRLKCDFF